MHGTFAIQNHGPHYGRGVAELHRVVLKCAVVTPITKEVRIESNIKVGRMRSMESQWTSKTIRILKGVMAMVPRSPVLSNSELVCEGIARSNGALSDGVHTVVFKRIQLTCTMHVNGCAIVT